MIQALEGCRNPFIAIFNDLDYHRQDFTHHFYSNYLREHGHKAQEGCNPETGDLYDV